MKRQKKKGLLSLTLMVSLTILVLQVVAILVAVLIMSILIQTGVLMVNPESEADPLLVMLFMALISLVLGVIATSLGIRFILRPVQELIRQMDRLAAGDYTARVDFKKFRVSGLTFQTVESKFNTMAEELQNTELLRSDFINNFSHEFKTPIVSITGLAKLMAKGNVTEEERMQYLHAIEEESSRLSAMATNVLRLTSVENQAILKDVTSFNLSEQVRSAVLLLEPKWSRKNLNIALDFLEYTVEANEELLMEVWINLLDNAIKFSPEGGTLSLALTESEHSLCVAIGNEGITIPKEKQERIFQKFYQADESHATMGNGIGLAIVKRIVDLHKGQISLVSEDGYTEFRITLHK